MLFGTALALWSWWGLVIFIGIKFIVRWRLLDEEKFLSKNLADYREHCQGGHYRLVPLFGSSSIY